MTIKIMFDNVDYEANDDRVTKEDFEKIADLAEDFLEVRPETCYDGDLFCICFNVTDKVTLTPLVEGIYEVFFGDAYEPITKLLKDLGIYARKCSIKRQEA